MSRSTITPHPSHRMGEVDGEVCCVICYAAPWMPIAEEQCQVGDTSPRERDALRDGEPEMRRTKGHPESTLRKAIELHDEGLRWEDVAVRLGLVCDGQTGRQAACALRVAISRYQRAGCKRGVLGRPQAMTREDEAAILRRQAAGEPLVAIAADMGITYERLTRRLRTVNAAKRKVAA